MTEIFLLLALSLITIMAIIVTHRFTGFLDLRNLSIIGFFALTYSFNIIGAVLIFFKRQDVSEGIRYSYLTMISLGFVGVCIGSVLVTMWKHFDPKETNTFLSSDFTQGLPLYSIFPSILIMIGLATLLFIVYAKSVPQLPIAYLLSPDMDGGMLKVIRAAGYKTVPQYVTHPMNFVRLTLFPYLIVLTFLLVRKYKTMSLRFLFAGTLLAGVVFNSYTTALFPIVMLFAILFLALWVTESIKIRYVPLFLVGGLSFPVLSAYLAQPSKGILYILKVELTRHFQRLFFDVPDILLSYVMLYWDAGSKLLGSAHRPIALLLGQEKKNVSNIVFLFRNERGYYLGNASAPFVGHLYADFGLWGVLIGAILTGIILQAVQIYCVRKKHNLFNLALYIMVVWMGFATPSTNITTGLLSKGLLPVLFMPWVMRKAGNFWYKVVRS